MKSRELGGCNDAESLLLASQPVLDDLPFALRHIRRCLVEHGHEPRDLLWLIGIADVVVTVLFRIDDQVAFGVQESEEWEARVLAADLAQNVRATRILQCLLLRALIDDEL